jgi:hypothetical protein
MGLQPRRQKHPAFADVGIYKDGTLRNLHVTPALADIFRPFSPLTNMEAAVQLLAVIADDKAGVQFFDGPRRRETASLRRGTAPARFSAASQCFVQPRLFVETIDSRR